MDSSLLGHGSDWWNGAMLASLGVAALAAVLVAMATAGVIEVQKREANSAKSELERYKLGVSSQVAEAKREGLAAGKTATDAELKAAQANERAAMLEKDAAEARLETERLKEQVAWRRVSKEQHAEIVNALAGRHFAIFLEFSQSDPEATQFADDLFRSLKNAGVTVYPPHPLVMPPAPLGVTISGANGADKEALKAALLTAKIVFATGTNTEGPPRLSIGSKKAPF